MEKNMKKNIYMYNWITLLYSRNYHNIVSQLYFKKMNFLKNGIYEHLVTFEIQQRSWQLKVHPAMSSFAVAKYFCEEIIPSPFVFFMNLNLNLSSCIKTPV